jgi:short subunit dehydrogenase-like uncharacterized protein
VNCAGPFATTAAPVIEAALRARIPYLDVAAEIEANADTFEQFSDRAREAGIVIMPAMAFYGGLGDLLATAAMRDWPTADEISIAYGLDRWRPTPGTRVAGQTPGSAGMAGGSSAPSRRRAPRDRARAGHLRGHRAAGGGGRPARRHRARQRPGCRRRRGGVRRARLPHVAQP